MELCKYNGLNCLQNTHICLQNKLVLVFSNKAGKGGEGVLSASHILAKENSKK